MTTMHLWHSAARRRFGEVYTYDGVTVAERVPLGKLALVTAAPALLAACKAAQRALVAVEEMTIKNLDGDFEDYMEAINVALVQVRSALAVVRGENG